MKFALNLFVIAFLTALALAAAPERQVIVSYPNDTPVSVLEQAKAAIVKAGGIIEHEYNIIKGFAAKAPAKALETVHTLGAKYNVLIEDDQVVHTNDDDEIV
ncbi:hypothetical protein K470DRAFT_246015 [Piedraia hortae CBS 480.64]|uniref:Inhibitor I9 domain-containing protein n=1 Tax=Piedraia hortae CBS 480.64 TaxID=1314780 RepID=A0A6A7C1X9_9PEZI|nr:hypothetical protein K470DRAFT_246015 [Piedraia hortae CBS 480.64]